MSFPFLTLEDPNAKIKGSRDPLGAQPIWTSFARHVVTNVTSAANSVRGFSVLLLGRYFGERLLREGAVPREELLNVFLRMEQLGAYARHVGHGVEGDIRGIDRVKSLLEEHKGRPYIEIDRRGLILSDQRVYGLWGLYSVSARTSGLIPEGPIGVSEAARAFIEGHYLPRLQQVERPLLRLLAQGGRINARAQDALFAALCAILPEEYTAEEAAFYGHHLRDARAAKSTGRDGGQEVFARLLASQTNLEGPVIREEAVALAEAARRDDEGLAHRLDRILHLEALLAPADALFDHVLTRHAQTPEDVAKALDERWGRAVPNLDHRAFAEILPEIESVTGRQLARSLGDCQSSLASGKYDAAIRALLDWNAGVMAARKSAPWARLEGGRIDVRYRGAEQLLPEEDELPTLWRNSYFFDSLKKITRQLTAVA